MKALYVYENISFERGREPKSVLEIGIHPKNKEVFVKYIIDRIPMILGRKNIPKDIIKSVGNFIKSPYEEAINSYLANFISRLGVDPYGGSDWKIVDTMKLFGYNIWEEIHDALYKIGYRR